MGKVLIVDDNEGNCELVEDMLVSWGHEVVKSFQGIDAIQSAVKYLPDLILLDVMLPGMNGFEVCYELKNNEITQNIPIIMLTVLDDLEDRIRGLKVGADTFLSKPINYNELRYIISTFINRKLAIDNMENCQQVVNTFLTMIQMRDVGLYLRTCKIREYCNRVAQVLFLDERQCARLSVGASVQDIGRIIDSPFTGHEVAGEHIIAPLKMSSWLNILVKHHHTRLDCPQFPRKLAMERHVLPELEILTTINRFVELCEEHENQDSNIQILLNEAQAGQWSIAVTEALHQLIKDEKLLKKLSAAT